MGFLPSVSPCEVIGTTFEAWEGSGPYGKKLQAK